MDCTLLPLFDLPPASIWSAFADSDAFGKLIVCIQLVMSMVLWSVMLSKGHGLSKTIRASGEFRRFFSETDNLLGYYFRHPRSRNPLIVVYSQAAGRIVRELEGHGGRVPTAQDAVGRTLSPASVALVKGVAEESLSAESMEVEKGMGLLAAGTTMAPLLGLLGTVTGVLFAFQSMADRGAVNLAAVAPGLSSAMLTTVVGLVVAIPSAAGYNFLVSKIRRLRISLDGFTDEFLGRVLSEFGEDGRR